MTRPGALILGCVALAGSPAAAQAPAQTPSQADAIDTLLRKPLPRDGVPDEPDTASGGAAIEADPLVPVTPQPYRAPYRTTLTKPVNIQETGKTADAPPSAADAAYDDRIRASAAAERGFRGPMDGGWTLSTPDRELYAFELADRNGAVEGAWRDLRRAGALDASGFIDAVERAGGDLTLHVLQDVIVVLHDRGDGRWSGELTEGGRSQAVNLRRRDR
jgi:hypothetical protein